MPDQEAIDAQVSLLHACRRTLWQYLRQQAMLSDAYPAGYAATADDLVQQRAQ